MTLGEGGSDGDTGGGEVLRCAEDGFGVPWGAGYSWSPFEGQSVSWTDSWGTTGRVSFPAVRDTTVKAVLSISSGTTHRF